MTLSYNEQMCDFFICSFDSFNVSFGFNLHLSACIVVDMARWHGVMWVQTQFQTYWVKCYFLKGRLPFFIFPLFEKGDDAGLVVSNLFFLFSRQLWGLQLDNGQIYLELPHLFVFFWRMYCMKQLSFKCKHFVHVEMRKWRLKSFCSLKTIGFFCRTVSMVRHSVWHQSMLMWRFKKGFWEWGGVRFLAYQNCIQISTHKLQI